MIDLYPDGGDDDREALRLIEAVRKRYRQAGSHPSPDEMAEAFAEAIEPMVAMRLSDMGRALPALGVAKTMVADWRAKPGPLGRGLFKPEPPLVLIDL